MMRQPALRSSFARSVVGLTCVTTLALLGCGGGGAPAGQTGTGGSGSGTGGHATGGSTATGGAGHGSGGSGTAATGGSAAGGSGAGGSGAVAGSGGTAVTGGGGVSGTGGTAGGGVISKVGITQCNDGIDNDGDGLIDLADPECTGPYDNDEGTFATGIPGDNMDACKQDCFFDGNSGMGDDGCLWQLQCDPQSNEPKCSYSADFVSKHQTECSISDSQTQHCVDYCRPLTPNGCDCFGCCQVPGVAYPIRLDSTCQTTADFGDPTKCPACTQVTQCLNTCGHCELCLGKTTLPADCATGGGPDGGAGGAGGADAGPPVPQCDPGIAPCGAGLPGCPESAACITGCCIPLF
jgi:hypothetical protein